mmetsp:Transcript_8664/g.24337  ORF Transcript_8664/g.24337 Transcript_8664/m.24337 type:complete len:360 (-) Transcript_8664:221-1300(-)|eukprot:CAMPEP_0181052580 /NCGR_PEP_ID=MMETSP1070-20121207/17662_1 /TAXON_ID=265543 /ORGANISM="Minutocellus polymorphus, Strain NH13" /LENGTH=359 /DNA_ID=CAMNT_0023131675 /DNA_START=74 /DNA_END=1153 /DNA_ORIENTATION=+
MATVPASRLDVRREFLSRLGANVQISDSIVVAEPSEDSTSSSEGTSQATARDRLDLLLGISPNSSSSVSASSLSCQDHISTFPSMCIFSSSPPGSPSSPARHQEVQDSASAEQIASSSLNCPVAYERREISSAPERLARSVTTTYTSLIHANIRQVTRNLRIRREDLPPIRIATVSSSFECIGDSNSDDGASKTTSQEDDTIITNFRIGIDFLLSIDSALATFSATASGSLTCYFSEDTSSGNHIDSVNLTVDGHQLLYSLRKQARVAALFALMAAASANGGAIGGNDIGNGQGADADVRPQPQRQPQRQAPIAVAAEQRALRCVSPEPNEYENVEMPPTPCEFNDGNETRNKRRRLDP